MVAGLGNGSEVTILLISNAVSCHDFTLQVIYHSLPKAPYHIVRYEAESLVGLSHFVETDEEGDRRTEIKSLLMGGRDKAELLFCHVGDNKG